MNADLPGQRKWRIVHSECSTGWGGQEHRVLAELAGFRRRGSETWLLAPERSGIEQRCREVGIPVLAISSAKLRFVPQVVSLSRWLRKNRIEIVNTHSSRDGWLVGCASRLARIPLLIRSRHIDVDYPNPWLSRHAYTTFADHILTTSRRITEHFQRIFQLPTDRISTVPTGIDVTRFRPDGVRNRLLAPGAMDQAPLIGMVSVLRSWKGHPVFALALRILADRGVNFQAVIVGEGPFRAQIQASLAEHGLSQRVLMAGHREDVEAVLRGLDVLVIPSTAHEGIPQIGLQAMACGTPVVGSDTGGIPEIIRPNETGRIFPSGDAVALADRLQETVSEMGRTRDLALAAVEESRRRHSLEVMLDTLEALYGRHLGTCAP